MIIALQTLVFFRESILALIHRLLRPYYVNLSLSLSRHGNASDDEDIEEQVFAEFDNEKGVVFYPPMYVQRYAAVSDCLMDERWCGQLRKVVDLGYHDLSFIKYLKELPGVETILGVDLDTVPLSCSTKLLNFDDNSKSFKNRDTPVNITLYQGNAADPDYRLIGCDAVIAIEMIEHMLPHDLDRMIHTVFGFIKPWIAIFSTPNSDFNVLFKALESNGLRRLDHYFEWTREQFHDWCSNIVDRYPDYTVTCKGIGPGPQGTIQYGCCSQLALFVSKDYHKQQDLDLNSLALVNNAPDPEDLTKVIENSNPSFSNSPSKSSTNSIGGLSLTEVLYADCAQSSITIVLTTPTYSLESLVYCDKVAQCDMEMEVGKNFLMFDNEEMNYPVLFPRRIVSNKIYEIEDVNSRLNCSTLQVKTFSKTTTKLLNKNKLESLSYTRDVMDEIKQLSKMLNLNKDRLNDSEPRVWNNINWGDNAPYWNQYFKVVKEYRHPFEHDYSEESRILDVITEEINKRIDVRCNEDVSVDVQRLEIPIEPLMNAVEHITSDVDRVKDLLEWNGYELQDDCVIFTRSLADDLSTQDVDLQDSFSDIETCDAFSTSFSYGSTYAHDYGRTLQRAIELKVRRLHKMVSIDKDVTYELDHVLSRLTKMALRSTRGRSGLPPQRWLHCRLYDLLALTEKAIERRRNHILSNLDQRNGNQDIVLSNLPFALIKYKQDRTGRRLLKKYKDLVNIQESLDALDPRADFECSDTAETDELSDASKDVLKDPFSINVYPSSQNVDFDDNDFDSNANTMQGICNKTTDEVKSIRNRFGFISSGDTDNSAQNNRLRIKKRTKSRSPQKKDSTTVLWKVPASKTSIEHKRNSIRKEKKLKDKSTNMKTIRKPARQKSNCLLKNCHDAIIPDYVNYGFIRTKQEIRESFSLYPTASKPIPSSLIHFCHPELNGAKNVDNYKWSGKTVNKEETQTTDNNESSFNNTEESQLANIVMDDLDEKTVLDSDIFGTETTNEEIECKDETSQTNMFERNKGIVDRPEDINEIVEPQAVYVYDVNEPTTSKGVRHTNTDAQCGPDVATLPYASVSETTSLSKLPRIFNTGIKIDDSMLNAFRDMKDFGMSTYDYSYEEAFNMANLDLRRDMGIDADMFAKNKVSEQSTHTDVYSNILTPRIPTMYKGIIIKDFDNSLSEENTMKDTGISTNDIHDLVNSKIEYTETKVSHIDIQDRQVSSTMTDDLLMYADQQSNLQIETKTLKAVSSHIRNEDSVSEFCESISTTRYSNSPNLKSECQIITPMSNSGAINRTSPAKKNRLSYVGAHVHSYKDRQVSEDVIYQGIWQEQRSKSAPPKKALNSIKPKISGGSMRKNIIKSTEKVSQKKIPIRPKSGKSNQDIGKKAIQKPKNATYKPIARVKKDVVKVCSRSSIKSVGSKTSKQSYITKKKQITFNHAVKNSYQYLRKFTEQMPKQNTTKDKLNEVHKTEDKRVKKNFLEINREKSKIAPPSGVAHKPETPRRKIIPNSLMYKSDDSFRSGEYRSRPKSEARSVFNDIEKNGNNDKFKPRSLSTPMRRTNVYDKQNDLTLFRESLAANVNFTVCCNMFNDKSSLENDPQSSNQNDTNENIFDQYNINPPSQTSSNCSSPNSVGTVKSVVTSRKNITNRPLSSISNKMTLDKSNPEAKSMKRPKTACKVEEKENLENEKINPKGMFTKKNKNVFIAQLTPETITMTKKGEKPVPSTTSEKTSEDKPPTEIEASIDEHICPQECSSAINEVLLIDARNFCEPPVCYSDIPIDNLSSDTHSYGNDLVELSEGESIRNWFENCSKLKKCDSDVVEDIKQLIEDKLTFITNALNDSTDIEPSSLFVSLENDDLDIISSVYSIQTVVEGHENENDNTVDDLKQHASDARSTLTETDRTSFKSTSSLSKNSDIYYTDNEFNTFENGEIQDISSVTGIFERKDPLMVQTTAGPISIQAFSGLSMNAEPSVSGDTPDFVNFVDSETGSFAAGVRRQATSEEIFVSGGSSGSYETCAVEEEAVVPEWLFEMLSQHDALEPLAAEVPVPEGLQRALDQQLDLNGNALEGVPHAGAGDGRGMHSDHSPDSSGHGSSYSSSDTSSGPRSEAVLVDPSAFNHYTTIPETTSDATILTMATADDSVRSLPVSGTTTVSPRQDVGWRPSSDTQLATSDGDADISSIDTDIQDYSDN